MNLKLVANDPYPQFEIYDNDRLLIRIKIDREIQVVRITCNDSRRAFFIIEEKLKRSTVWNLLNEYSQPLGTLAPHKTLQNSGEVEVEGIKLNYRLKSYPVKELILFENNNDVVLNCRINDALLLQYKNYIHYFIFALSWVTFLFKEKTEAIYLAEA